MFPALGLNASFAARHPAVGSLALIAQSGAIAGRGQIETPHGSLVAGLAIPEPTATARLQTQRFLFPAADEPEGFVDAQWSGNLPILVQAKLLESFENYDISHAPVRADNLSEGGLGLVLDLRQFDIVRSPDSQRSSR